MKFVANPTPYDLMKWVHLQSLRKLVYDNSGKRCELCGQACVAMVANVWLDDAIVACQQTGPTRTDDLTTALKMLGVGFQVIIPAPEYDCLPDKCILRVSLVPRSDRVSGHWVVKKGDRIYNPDNQSARKLEHIGGLDRKTKNPIKTCIEILE